MLRGVDVIACDGTRIEMKSPRLRTGHVESRVFQKLYYGCEKRLTSEDKRLVLYAIPTVGDCRMMAQRLGYAKLPHCVVFVLGMMCVSCSPCFQMLQEAERLEQRGLTEEAFDKYAEAKSMGFSNNRAIAGLHYTGIKMVCEYLEEADGYVASGDLEKALSSYRRAIQWVNQLGVLGIQVDERYALRARSGCKKAFENDMDRKEMAKLTPADRVGRYEAARKTFQNVSRLCPGLEWPGWLDSMYEAGKYSLVTEAYSDGKYEETAKMAADLAHGTYYGDKSAEIVGRCMDSLVMPRLRQMVHYYEAGRYREALQMRREALKAAEGFGEVGSRWEMPERYSEIAEGIGVALRREEAQRHYQKAMTAYEARDLQEAVKNLEKTVSVLPDYEDARGRLNDARAQLTMYNAERYYATGVERMRTGKHRGAMAMFKKSSQEVPGYRDAEQMYAKAREKATVRIGLAGFGISSSCVRLGEYMESVVFSEMYEISDPFVRIVERKNIEGLLREQALSLSGAVADASVVEVGRLLGANVVAWCNVTNCDTRDRKTQVGRKTGYRVRKTRGTEQRYRSVYNPTTRQNETDPYVVDVEKYAGEAVGINTWEESREVVVRVSYRVVDVETGAVLDAGSINEAKTDQVIYTECGGCDYRRLWRCVPNDREKERASSLHSYHMGGGTVDALMHAAEDVACSMPPVREEAFTGRRALTDEGEMMQRCGIRIAEELRGRLVEALP